MNTSFHTIEHRMTRRFTGVFLSLIMAIGIFISSVAVTNAASMTWTSKGISVTTDNAVVSVTVTAPSKGRWTAASGTIYDSKGNVVASKKEGANYNTSYMNIWYDIKGEMNKTLKPGTTYYVQYTATYNGSTYTSGKYKFTTKAKPKSNTGNASGKSSKIDQFLADGRWANGTSWGYYQRPKLSSYDSIGCCAFTADYVKYVYGKDSPRSGAKFTSTSEIRGGDVLEIDGHWLVVLSRSGNTLKVAEGNVRVKGSDVTRVSTDTWTISGNSLKNKYENYYRALISGYHY